MGDNEKIKSPLKENAEKPREECGVFGMYLPHPFFYSDVVTTTLSGLLANQHRGEESAGIMVADGEKVSSVFKRLGLVSYLYRSFFQTDQLTRDDLQGYISVAHTRYSTTGGSSLENAAPFRFKSQEFGTIGVAHNGNLTNALKLKEGLIEKGYKFSSTTDSEVIGAMILASAGKTLDEKIKNALIQLEGSFSLIIISKDTLYGARDRIGNRPLSYAKIEKDGHTGYAISSETCAFDRLGLSFQDDVKPGEIIKFNKSGLTVDQFADQTQPSFCALEVAYLLRADSRIKGIQIDSIRRYLGEQFIFSHPPPYDVEFVTYIPESSKQSAEGTAEGLSKLWKRRVPLITSLMKNRYGDINGGLRGFIQPSSEKRQKIATFSYSPFDCLNGATVLVVDDSLIRGSTTKGVYRLIREAGAKRIYSAFILPKVVGFCPLGTDIDSNQRLIARANNGNIEKMKEELGSDWLAFLSPEEFRRGVNEMLGCNFGLCLGCCDGKYPVNDFDANKEIFERR